MRNLQTARSRDEAVFTGKLDGAGLRALFTLLLGIVDRPSFLRAVKARLRHAVSVKVDFPPVVCFEKAIIFFREKLAHGGMRLRLMQFHAPALTAAIILHLAPPAARAAPVFFLATAGRVDVVDPLSLHRFSRLGIQRPFGYRASFVVLSPS
jgi:hypothetical protein